MKSNNKETKNTSMSLDEALQNKTDNNSAPAQKDGFRYDYNDSSDFKHDK